MIILGEGTRALDMYDVEMSKEGVGRLYLLNNGLLFDARGKGVRFEAHFTSIVNSWIVRPDRFFITIRKRWRNKTYEFRIIQTERCFTRPNTVETELQHAISVYRENTAMKKRIRKVGFWNRNKIDFDLFCNAEATWLECNWYKVMSHVKPESHSYLESFKEVMGLGSPCLNPYEAIVKFESLAYDDFLNLPDFLSWRYRDMTPAELEMAVSLFKDYKRLSISTFEIQVERQLRSKDYVKHNHSLFEHVIITCRMTEEERSAKARQNPECPKVTVENLHTSLPLYYHCGHEIDH